MKRCVFLVLFMFVSLTLLAKPGQYNGAPANDVAVETVAAPSLILGTKVLMLTEGESVALTYFFI